MTSNELIEEIRIELDNIEVVLKELACLYQDVKESEVSFRDKTAAAAFLAQFYGGIENILKRISRFYEVNLPSSELWHVELFKRFCDPPLDPLPIIFDKSLSQDLAPFRKFRHVGPRPFTMSLPRLRLSVLHPKSGTNKHRRYMITQSKVKFYTPHDNVNAV